jgi:hypothetical protein
MVLKKQFISPIVSNISSYKDNISVNNINIHYNEYINILNYYNITIPTSKYDIEMYARNILTSDLCHII